MQHIYLHTKLDISLPTINRIDTLETFFDEVLRQVNCSKKVFLVRGRKSYEMCGAKDILDRQIVNSGCDVYEFSDFNVNPQIKDAYKGTELIKQFNPDIIIAVGGGSVIDMSKLVRHYAKKTNIPLVAIPTTSGTGAESTQFAVCYQNGIKQSIDGSDMLPEYVLLEPKLTLNNNDYLTACTGFDALAQAIEAYWSINATPESDRLALDAVKLIYPNLPDMSSNLDLRTKLMIGANLAGQAINITRTTAPHAMSYTLTSKFDYPHGHAVALTFPFFLEYNVLCPEDQYSGSDYKTYKNKMTILQQLLNPSIGTSLFAIMKHYTENLGLNFDINKPIEASAVEQGINIERAKNNPLRLTSEIIHKATLSIFE